MSFISNSVLKKAVKPLIPPVLTEQIRNYSRYNEEKTKRVKFERLRSSVPEKVQAIRNLRDSQSKDAHFLEHEFIPWLGLNDEMLEHYPAEFRQYYGTGLHIWQYPNQLAKLLTWIAENAKEIRCYMEIGCRWGGMFILLSEWLRKHSNKMATVLAVDVIEPTPLIKEYFSVIQNTTICNTIEPKYIRQYSTSPEVKCVVERAKPDFVLIDGDHSLRGALADHMLVRENARIIVHHDVFSDTCPDTTMLWSVLKQLERYEFNFFEFLDQYDSVKRRINGFGVLHRKASGGAANEVTLPSNLNAP